MEINNRFIIFKKESAVSRPYSLEAMQYLSLKFGFATEKWLHNEIIVHERERTTHFHSITRTGKRLNTKYNLLSQTKIPINKLYIVLNTIINLLNVITLYFELQTNSCYKWVWFGCVSGKIYINSDGYSCKFLIN